MSITMGSIIFIALLVGSMSRCTTINSRYPKSDHFNGKHFFNRQKAKEHSFWDTSKLLYARIFHKKAWPKPFITKTKKVKAKKVTNGIHITWINHSTVLLQLLGINIITDPVYAKYAGPNQWISFKRITNPAIKFSDLPHIDLILLSHNHYDHLDIETIKNLYAKQKTNPPRLITGLGVGKYLKKNNIIKVNELDWGKKINFKNLEIFFLEAVHNSGRGLFDRNKTLWGSFLIKTKMGNIYFAGDTAYSNHFKKVAKKFGPVRVSLLPIGAYLPRWFMKSIHISPSQAVQAHKDLKSKKSIAIHYGTFDAANDSYDDPSKDFHTALKKHKIKKEDFVLLKLGETLVIDRRNKTSLFRSINTHQ